MVMTSDLKLLVLNSVMQMFVIKMCILQQQNYYKWWDIYLKIPSYFPWGKTGIARTDIKGVFAVSCMIFYDIKALNYDERAL